jgi:hypothetical protein
VTIGIGFNLSVADARSRVPIREFSKSNPKCCRVDRNPKKRSLIEKFIGSDRIEVEVNFPVKESRRAEIGSYYEAYVLISPCGKVVGEYGAGNDKPKQAE